MSSNTCFIRLFALMLSLALVGCSSSVPEGPSYGSEDGKSIAMLIEEFNEDLSDPKRFKAAFSGTPPEIKKYSGKQFNIQGSPKIDGSTATATILISQDGTGQDLGKLDWTFERGDSGWKIKNAPLP